jgi:hypothetical protein
MSSTQRYAKKQAKARHRRHRNAQERLERDRRQAQQAAEALEQALQDLGLPANLVAEIEGRLRSQQGPTGGSAARLTAVLAGGSPAGAIPHLAP